MSHFTSIKTKIIEKQYLLKALEDMKYKWKEGNVEIRGYQGIRSKAEISIKTKNPDYDIGFIKEKDTYDLIADWWGIEDIKQEEFVQTLTQRYAYHAVKDQLEQQNFTFVEEVVKEDNSIHISVRRMT